MKSDRFSDDLTETNWHGITDHPADRLEMVVLARPHEGIGPRKRLENRSLAQRDAAILLWVPESTIAEPIELSGDRGRRFIPHHAPINARVGLSGLLFVAGRPEVAW